MECPSCGVVFFTKLWYSPNLTNGTCNKTEQYVGSKCNSFFRWVWGPILWKKSGWCAQGFQKGAISRSRNMCVYTWLRFACSVVGQKSQTYSWWNSCWWFPMGSSRIESVKKSPEINDKHNIPVFNLKKLLGALEKKQWWDIKIYKTQTWMI